jgi:membrane-associated PAP2 superfamily phosphatase
MRIHRTGRNGTNGHVNPAEKASSGRFLFSFFFNLFDQKKKKTEDNKVQAV